MSEVEENLDTNLFKNYYQWFIDEGDKNNAHKIIEVYEKLKTDMFYLCFTGHFSAGKSSLINYMVGDEVLPKSPIPTSANIVKLKAGDGSVKVYFKNKNPILYHEPYDIDIIKDYATDRGSIKEIQMYLNNTALNDHSVLMDTPGIDASDDADRFMTESVLHLIDELFYVMDYNHVQSEVNLYFLQQINKLNIPIHIVINQIDKHNEEELPFEIYKRSIEQTFEQWRIHPDTMHFTSSKYLSHPLNEIESLKSFIFDKLTNHASIKSQISHAIQAIRNDHKKFLESKYEVEIEDDIDDSHIEKGKKINERLNVLSHISQAIKKEFVDEMNLTLKNAYLMPSSLRDIVESFLESEQEDFKVGFLGSKKKTQLEKDVRKDKFKAVLQESANTTIEWKLKEKLHAIFKAYQVSFDEIFEAIQAIDIEVPDSIIENNLSKGAKVTGNYVLNYSNDVSHAVKQFYRSELNRILKQLLDQLNELTRPEKEQLEDELNHMSDVKSLLQHESQNQAALQTRLNAFEQIDLTKALAIDIDEKILKMNEAIVESHPVKIESKQNTQTQLQDENDRQPGKYTEISTEEITDIIDNVVSSLHGVKGFKRLENELNKRNHAIKHRELTIALFGTFSAGKSSFSNALFGEKILPVSPNPTTAVISKIKPVSTSKSHGTVIIRNKSKTEMVADIETITKYISDENRNYDEWIQWLSQHRISSDSRLSKVYQSYIEAILKGDDLQGEKLGNEVEISLDQFGEYVTDEAKACFIKEVELYYDCEITRKGITIVDTPGADSVNARHTNVAFDYIKDADAIIYVTYYNHAITSGDRDFLMQLGRVKESFEMDKMFFVVNAADLAENEEELSLVVDYVNDQLVQFGIRNAKIFPLSSKDSLEDKLTSGILNEKMMAFEKDFYQFIEKDLIQLLIEGAFWDIQRVENTLKAFISSLSYSKSERKQKIEAIKMDAEKAEEIIDAKNTNAFESRLIDRIERQLHFVEERFSIRFNDMFQEFFNPSQINESGKKGRKQVEQARNELVDYAGYELLQEIRAVALRMEQLLRKLQTDAYEIVQKRLMELNEMFALPQLDLKKIETPALEQAFESLDLNLFDKSVKKYKNTKSFFAKNEVEVMRSEFYDILFPEGQTYITKNQKYMLDYYTSEWQNVDTNVTKNQYDEINTIVAEYTDILSNEDNLTELVALSEKIEKITNKISQVK